MLIIVVFKCNIIIKLQKKQLELFAAINIIHIRSHISETPNSYRGTRYSHSLTKNERVR
jgi:hypothetical protein